MRFRCTSCWTFAGTSLADAHIAPDRTVVPNREMLLPRSPYVLAGKTHGEVIEMKIHRRELLYRVGTGSIALASLPALLDMLRVPALAQSERGTMFLAVNAAGTHRLAMGGVVKFDPSKGAGSPAAGGGSFFHWTVGTPPMPLVASGTWKARLLTSYKEAATYAGVAAGVGAFVIDLQRVRPSPALIPGAVLTIYCNLGPAGIGEAQTGGIEGFTLSIPGTDFSAGGNPGIFRQIPPGGTGVTIFLQPESLT
jgi:hypothetical protein